MPLTTDPVCSARGCRDAAVWALRWNNPRLHTPERRKTWVACDEHRVSLTEFLTVRGFLRETVTTAQLRCAPSTTEPLTTEQTTEQPSTGRP